MKKGDFTLASFPIDLMNDIVQLGVAVMVTCKTTRKLGTLYKIFESSSKLRVLLYPSITLCILKTMCP